MATNRNRRDLESERGKLLAEMERQLSPDLKKLIDLSYKLSKKEPESIKVTTSNSTSISNFSDA